MEFDKHSFEFQAQLAAAIDNQERIDRDKVLHALNAENAKLREENRRLRELVRNAFREGVNSGMKETSYWSGGVTWSESESRRRLYEIWKGNGDGVSNVL